MFLLVSVYKKNHNKSIHKLILVETCKLKFFLIMDVQLGAWANHSDSGRFKCRSGAAS